MKYVVRSLIFIGFLSFSNSIYAQNKHSEKFEQFKKEMDLSDAQVLKIKAIKDKYAQEKKELKERLEEIRLKELEEIDRIYSAEQKAKLKVILERHRAQKNAK